MRSRRGMFISKKCVLVPVYPGSYCTFGPTCSRTRSSYPSLDRSGTAESSVDCRIVRRSSQGSRTVGSPLDRRACRAILVGSVLSWISYCAWLFPGQFLTLSLILFIFFPIHSLATPFIHPFFNSFIRSSIYSFVYQFIRSFVNSFVRSSLSSFTRLSFQLSHWGIFSFTCSFT